MESSIIIRVVKKELLLANKESNEGYNSDYKAHTNYNTNNWKMKIIVTDSLQGAEKQVGRVDHKPRRHDSRAELDEKPRKIIYFKYDGAWHKDHKCPNKELRVLTVLNGYEVEVLEGNIEEDIVEEPICECITLSFSSYIFTFND
ncbi:hypothetical protein CARUB_v10025717mg [Capsella rubella]|uniref:Uncharacterized protein n=1 Tax=Capsella rubella TaxID=81985 RepID=R0HVI6_9BRAS|nr:hypothetical protein CARUB_v10025717mg [Capsella rubella]